MHAVIEYQIREAGLVAGDKLLVAVSGGVDSVALLHLLHEQSIRTGLRLYVAHLDHQIRQQSAADAEFVRCYCEGLGLECFIERCNVPEVAAEKGFSLEMAGRDVRREFLLRVADEVGARLIALAHHRDDQVETFLLRLLRGSGVAGLTAMQSLRGRWWRPLLGCSRRQIEEYAAEHRLAWVEDASNGDLQYQRNRVRHRIVPELQAVNPRFEPRVVELCRQFSEDQDYWFQQVADVMPGVTISTNDGVRLDRQGLLALPAALRVRLLRAVMLQLRGDLQRIEAIHLRAVDALLAGDRSEAQLDLPGCWVARRYDQLWLRRTPPVMLAAYELAVPVPGQLQLPCGRVLRSQLVAVSLGESVGVAEFDREKLAGELRVRSWRAGDSFSPLGIAGRKKLKRLFGDRKTELEERARVPLLVAGDEILWVAGMRRSSYALVSPETQQILRLELLDDA